MPKWLKNVVAVLLLPVCVGAAQALTRLVGRSGHAEFFWVMALAGAACWTVVYLMMPKPMWIYVFGHELTHALWTWVFGGRVKRFKVTSKGGHVIIDKNNFVIVNGQQVERTPDGDYVAEGDGPQMLLKRYIETLPGGTADPAPLADQQQGAAEQVRPNRNPVEPGLLARRAEGLGSGARFYRGRSRDRRRGNC